MYGSGVIHIVYIVDTGLIAVDPETISNSI